MLQTSYLSLLACASHLRKDPAADGTGLSTGSSLAPSWLLGSSSSIAAGTGRGPRTTRAPDHPTKSQGNLQLRQSCMPTLEEDVRNIQKRLLSGIACI